MGVFFLQPLIALVRLCNASTGTGPDIILAWRLGLVTFAGDVLALYSRQSGSVQLVTRHGS